MADSVMNLVCSFFGTGSAAVPYQVNVGLLGFTRVGLFKANVLNYQMSVEDIKFSHHFYEH